jgi:DNA primase
MVRCEGKETFYARMESALPFSLYFFNHLVQGLEVHTIEGSAALVKLAKPLIEKIPGGVFREILEARLAELAGHDSFIDAEKSSTLVKTSLGHPGMGVELSPLRMVLILLLQHPKLAAKVSPESRERLARHPKAGEFIGKLLDLIEETPGIHSAGIWQFFQETSEGSWIDRLIDWETGVVTDQIPRVFADCLSAVERQLEEQIRNERWNILRQKRPSELTQSEREEIRNLALR